MKVNLRKAATIQAEIRNYISELDIKLEVEIPFNRLEAETLMESSMRRLEANVSTTIKLLEVLTNIRMNVSTANTSSGISALLTKESSLKQSFKLLESLKNAKPAPSSTMLGTIIEKNMAADVNSYGGYGSHRASTDVSFMKNEFLSHIKQELTKLKREKIKIIESLLSLNIQTEIEINDHDYNYLVELGIV